MSKAKAKGTRAETAVVRFVNDRSSAVAERRALSGKLDKGDIIVRKDGEDVCILEVKAGGQTLNPNRTQVSEWLSQTDVEKTNAELPGWLVVVRYRRALADADVYKRTKIDGADMVCRVHMYLDEFVEYLDRL